MRSNSSTACDPLLVACDLRRSPRADCRAPAQADRASRFDQTCNASLPSPLAIGSQHAAAAFSSSPTNASCCTHTRGWSLILWKRGSPYSFGRFDKLLSSSAASKGKGKVKAKPERRVSLSASSPLLYLAHTPLRPPAYCRRTGALARTDELNQTRSGGIAARRVCGRMDAGGGRRGCAQGKGQKVKGKKDDNTVPVLPFTFSLLPLLAALLTRACSNRPKGLPASRASRCWRPSASMRWSGWKRAANWRISSSGMPTTTDR